MIGNAAGFFGKLMGYILVAIMFTSGVAVLAQAKPNEVTLPAPSGSYAVGREAFDWTDENRDDPFALTTVTKRSLTGFMWYPAATASGKPAP